MVRYLFYSLAAVLSIGLCAMCLATASPALAAIHDLTGMIGPAMVYSAVIAAAGLLFGLCLSRVLSAFYRVAKAVYDAFSDSIFEPLQIGRMQA